MANPPFTSLDAADLYKFAESLTLVDGRIVHPDATGEIGLAAISSRLMAIAQNLETLSHRVETAFRDGQLQAEVNRVEHSNVATYADLSAAAKEAIAAGRVTVKTLPPAAPAKRAMPSIELTLEDLDLDL